MSLRSRLLVGLVAVLVLVVGLAFVVVDRQRAILLDQLDDRLVSIAPLEPRDQPSPPPPGQEPPAADRRPISDIVIGRVDADGTVELGVEGQLVESMVDVSALAAEPVAERTFLTLGSVDGTSTFRVLAEPSPDGRTAFVALPSDDVDQTIDRLIVTFVVVAAVIAAVLAAVIWWVWRLGLRPITDMTEIAQAIARGQRNQRVTELSPATEAGRLGAALNTMLDERDAGEERLRRFVSDASHELRTPLTSIQGYLEVYRNGGFRGPGQTEDALRRMTAESDRMAALVEDLLHLARLDEQRPLAIAQTDIGELLRDICADASTARPELDIGADAPPRGQLLADVDRNLVAQVVAGLIDNAATHAPGASIEVTARLVEAGLEISVADDGPGLDPEAAAHVFDRFYRSDDDRSRQNGGSGLGLAIAAAVAERHGGTLELDTAVGAGCTFTLRLPATPTND